MFTSSSGAPAIIEGKALFVTHPTGYLNTYERGKLEDIENPNYDLDRDKFLHEKRRKSLDFSTNRKRRLL